MGVSALWVSSSRIGLVPHLVCCIVQSLLSPVGRQIEVRALKGKRLAVDASIWIVQFLSALRGEDGRVLHNAHLLGFFKRICRLLFHRIKPVFVFDGGVPELKKRTIKARRNRRNKQTAKLKRTAEKLLLGRLKQRLLNDGSSASTVQAAAKKEEPSQRVESEEEWSSEEELDFGTVDMKWLFSLPPSQQYEHLVQMRDKQFAVNRQILNSVTGKPQKFSQTQMDLFLKSSSFRHELQEMRRHIGGSSGNVQRLANEPNRVFVYTPGDESNQTSWLLEPDLSNQKKAAKPSFPFDGFKTLVDASRVFDEQKRKAKEQSIEVAFHPQKNKKLKAIAEENADDSDDKVEWESIEMNSPVHLSVGDMSQDAEDDEISELDQLLEKATDEELISHISIEDIMESNFEEIAEPRFENQSTIVESEKILEKGEDTDMVVLEDQAEILSEESLKTLQQDFQKLSKQVDSPTQEMFAECQELLQLFGIPFIIAPLEAEAQCAFLNEARLVDGVITNDSDVFLFGGQKVYKNIFNDGKFVEEYLMKDIEEELGLTRARIIDLALLLGSDYTEGIHGIGIVNAMEIVSAFDGPEGLSDFAEWARGEALEEEVKELTKEEEEEFDLVVDKQERDSRHVVDNKAKNHDQSPEKEVEEGNVLFQDQFKEQHKEIRRGWNIPESFPNDFVRKAYHEPRVDSNMERFTFGRPDGDRLGIFCQEKFGWTDEKAREVLLPVLSKVDEKMQQLTLESFLFDRRRFAKIKSQRLQDAVSCLTGKYNPEIMVQETSPSLSKSKNTKKRKQP